MARTKSDLLSSMGSGFEILKAITDSVIDRGGNDDDVRRILKDKKVRNAIADILVTDQKFFTFTVDFDDPKWKAFPFKGNYAGVNSDLKSEHFPVRYSGKAEVTVEVVQYDEGKTFEEHLNICQKQGAPEIDLPISETFHELFPDERKKGWILSPCGSQVERGGRRSVAFVSADGLGVYLYIYWIDCRWYQSDRFLVLREVKPLAA
jgi:hypothetical protein